MRRAMDGSAVRLESGDRLVVRPTEPQDAPAVGAFLEGLSGESRRLRYHTPVPEVRWWMVEAVTGIDHDHREALLALIGDEIVGLAEWGREREGDSRAHVAIVVDERFRRRGIAQGLMRRLACDASEHGIQEFVATVLTFNRPVFGLIQRMAPERSSRFDGDVVEFVIPIAPCRGQGVPRSA